MFYKRRKQQDDLKRREAAGESFWQSEFPAETRNRLFWWLEKIVYEGELRKVLLEARSALLLDEGGLNLRGQRDEVNDFLMFYDTCDGEAFASCVESILAAAAKVQIGTGFAYSASYLYDLHDRFQEVLVQDRIAWELTDGHKMIPFESKELFHEVIQPTLSLLSSKIGWEKAETAYQHALEELSSPKGKPDDAITDAGTALQEALVAAGAVGDNLGALLTNAQKKGLFTGHDVILVESLRKVMDWVSAERSQSGDSHRVSNASPNEAWLMVHIVGALIVWLAGEG